MGAPDEAAPAHPATPKNPRRSWCFTVFNPDESAESVVRDLASRADVRRCAVGRERCPTTGTPHLQGYVGFRRSVRFAGVRKLLPPGAHIEAREALKECEASQYCLKDGDVLVDVGLDSDADGVHLSKHDECDQVISEIEQGESYGQIRKRHRQFVFWFRRNVFDYIKDERELRPQTALE